MDFINAHQNRRILVVDDMPAIHEDFRKVLRPAATATDLDEFELAIFGVAQRGAVVDFVLDSAHQGQEAVAMVRDALQGGQPYAMAFVDMRMPPGWDGVETIERLWQEDPRLQVVICTAHADQSWGEVLNRLDAKDRLLILKKPFDPIEVCQLASMLTTKWQVTEDARHARSLREEVRSMALMQAIADGSQDAIFAKDASGRYLMCNREACRSIGRPVDQILGRTDLELFAPAQAASIMAIDALVREGNRNITYDQELETSDGQVTFMAVSGPLHDTAGAVIGSFGIARDITQRKLAESALRASEAFNKAILDSVNANIAVLDGRGVIVAVNAPWRMFALQNGPDGPDAAASEAHTGIGANYLDVCEASLRAAPSAELREAIDGIRGVMAGRLPSFGMAYPCHAPQEQRWFGMNVTPIGDGHQGVVVTHTNITRRKQIEAALEASEALLDRTGRIGGVGGWELDLETEAIRWTDQTCRIHDVEPGHRPTLAEAMGYCAPDARPALEHAVRQSIDTGEGYDLELPFVTTSGRPIWVRAVAEVEFVDGKAVRLFGALQDITGRRKAESEAVRSTTLLRGAIDAIDEAFVLFDPDDRLVFCNEKYRMLYGAVADWIVPGMSYEAILRASAERGLVGATGDHAAWLAERMSAHRSGRATLELRLSTGRVLRAVDRRLPDGHTVGFRIDITDLTLATEAAQAASEAKGQFLANMSHEIRTPMSAVLGMLALLRRHGLTPRQADYASKAERAARSLLRLLNEILDFSKIEAAQMGLDPRPFRIDHLLRDLEVIASSTIGDKPVELTFHVDPTLPRWLVGDAMRLQQVLVNLCGNAIKFTERGTVTLTVALASCDAHGVALDFAVQDSGIGISPENIARLFSSFMQAEASTTRRFGGTGLGLAISQRLVALMGGRIDVDSAPGVGSRFHFRLTLPLGEATQDTVELDSQAASSSVARLDGLRMLVVEDNPNNQQVALELLELVGVQVTLACNGADAVASVRAAEPPFDIVLMDLQMPVMDGFAATRLIREVAGHRELPIVAMTANAMTSDRDACLAAGMNDHVGKPFDLEQLVAVVLRLVRRGAGTATVAWQPADLPHPVREAAAAAGVDIEGALARMAGQQQFYVRFLKDFISELPALQARLRTHLAQAQVEAAKDLLHSLKGLAASVGASALSMQAADGEAALRDRPPPSPLASASSAAALASHLAAELDAAIDAALPALGTLAAALHAANRDAAASDATGASRSASRLGHREFHDALRALAAQLRIADMAATDTIVRLQDGADPLWAERLLPVDRAIDTLDFPLALQLCESLTRETSA